MNTTQANTVFCDCWTSGNPGIGGYRVVDASKRVLVERNWDTKNTNNFYELGGLGAAIKHLNGAGVVYTDSAVAMAWVMNGRPSKDFRKRQEEEYVNTIQKVIDAIRALPFFSLVEIRRISGGANPADYGRKPH